MINHLSYNKFKEKLTLGSNLARYSFWLFLFVSLLYLVLIANHFFSLRGITVDEQVLTLVQLVFNILIVPVLMYLQKLHSSVSGATKGMDSINKQLAQLVEGIRELPRKNEWKSGVYNLLSQVAKPSDLADIDFNVKWNKDNIAEAKKKIEHLHEQIDSIKEGFHFKK